MTAVGREQIWVLARSWRYRFFSINIVIFLIWDFSDIVTKDYETSN